MTEKELMYEICEIMMYHETKDENIFESDYSDNVLIKEDLIEKYIESEICIDYYDIENALENLEILKGIKQFDMLLNIDEYIDYMNDEIKRIVLR